MVTTLARSMSGFAITSTRSEKQDVLGRSHRRLSLAPSWAGGIGSSSHFDHDELRLFATRCPQPAWPDDLDRWPSDNAHLLPWALTHGLLPGPASLHLHADTLCVLASFPDASEAVARAYGARLTWLPFTVPGPALASLAVARSTERAVLVAGVGLLLWGDAPAELLQRAADLEALASTISGTSQGGGVAGPLRHDSTALLCAVRGHMSTAGRVILAVDEKARPLADQAGVEDLARAAEGTEWVWPWTWRSMVVRQPSAAAATALVPPDAPPQVALIPGVGVVTAGPDENGASLLRALAGHTLRVTAALMALPGAPAAARPARSPVNAPRSLATPVAPGHSLQGRVYVVTGAATGIGRDVARHLAKLGASLALGDVKSDTLTETADELAADGIRPLAVHGDLTDEHVVERLVEATIHRYGGIDGAVLNAGVAIPGEIKSLSAADWRRSLEVNATSHFLLAQRLLRVLEQQGLGGSLVFIGSKNMFAPGAGFGAYSASKGALAQLARSVAIEGGAIGVRSNIVNPDNVFGGSALWSPELRAQRAAVYGIKAEDLEDYYTHRNLLKVAITGQDVAKAVAFMLSDDALRTTACVLTVDGGVPGVFPR